MLGTDGIGADMLEEARLAYVRLREYDVDGGARMSSGRGSTTAIDSSPSVATIASTSTTTTPTVHGTPCSLPACARSTSTLGSGEVVLRDGLPTRVDLDEVRAKAAEQAARLFAKL